MKGKGFVLLELIITVIIVVALTWLGVVQFMSLKQKADHGSTKNNLTRMRNAIIIYYGDHEGVFPEDDLSSLVPRYIEEILEVKTHSAPASGTVYTPGTIEGHAGAGGWFYDNDKNSPDFGKLIINAKGVDSKGLRWDSL